MWWGITFSSLLFIEFILSFSHFLLFYMYDSKKIDVCELENFFFQLQRNLKMSNIGFHFKGCEGFDFDKI